MKIINGKLVPDEDATAAAAAAPAAPAAAPATAAEAAPAAGGPDPSLACMEAAHAAMASDAPTTAQLRAMLGVAGEEKGLNIVCRQEEYDTLLAAKVDIVRALFRDAGITQPEIDVQGSPTCFFRMRADFRTWHTGSYGKPDYKMFYSMFPSDDKRRPVEIPAFPMGARRVNELMEGLRSYVIAPGNDLLRTKLYEVRFLTTLAGDSLITMIYHRQLQDDGTWTAAAQALAKHLGVSGIVGRSRKVKLVVGRDYVLERLQVCGEEFSYRQTEGSFSQPNATVCQKMLTFAVEATVGSQEEDLLELYCGNGNFTAPLSRTSEAPSTQ